MSLKWKYQIVKYPDGGYALHEVHYDEKNKPYSMSVGPTTFEADSDPKNIIKDLELALSEAKRNHVFTVPKDWKK